MMSPPPSQPSSSTPGDDQVIPYHVEALEIRGRAVQLGPMLNTILDSHNYPQPVSHLLAQAICLGVLLGSSLKFEGRFTIQIQSDGPVSLLVVEYTTPGSVRAYAGFDEQQLASSIKAGKSDPQSLLGDGTLAMTVDQKSNAHRYQGIVALQNMSLEEAAHQYFRQSEQIPTKVKLGVAQLVEVREGGGTKTSWRAGGMTAQFLPQASDRLPVIDLPGGEEPQKNDMQIPMDDAWLETQSLIDTVSDDELTDPQIGVERLLYRLFHQHGVEVYPASPIVNKCSCSRQKIVSIINSFSQPERSEAFAASEKPGRITSKCEFCGKRYDIAENELNQGKK
ncbi:MAG: Hsp33 family molecular chaperone [Rhizobiaceae bacterium]|nr:Hsp33 family molecular chaperone [Rhizobiaceae bacterium]